MCVKLPAMLKYLMTTMHAVNTHNINGSVQFEQLESQAAQTRCMWSSFKNRKG